MYSNINDQNFLGVPIDTNRGVVVIQFVTLPIPICLCVVTQANFITHLEVKNHTEEMILISLRGYQLHEINVKKLV